MNSLAQFSAAARGKPQVQQHTILPDSNSPGVAITRNFLYQSYFDSTLLHKAILTQSVNEPIVGSTKDESKLGGYALALHPSSQTPVAVQPLVGGSSASPGTIILRPGQIWRPHGRLNGEPGNFSGFNWGLPFGWLGGGTATLYVLSASDAAVFWQGAGPEIIFHRQRMQILAPAGLAAQANANLNWPLRFPWPNAVRGSASVAQGGQAIVSVGRPSRVLMSLRNASMATADTMRVLFQATNDLNLDSTGATILNETRFIDYVWGIYAVNGGGGNLGVNYPVVELSGEIVRLAADDGGVQLVDMSAGTLTNAYVDCVRYGEL